MVMMSKMMLLGAVMLKAAAEVSQCEMQFDGCIKGVTVQRYVMNEGDDKYFDICEEEILARRQLLGHEDIRMGKNDPTQCLMQVCLKIGADCAENVISEVCEVPEFSKGNYMAQTNCYSPGKVESLGATSWTDDVEQCWFAKPGVDVNFYLLGAANCGSRRSFLEMMKWNGGTGKAGCSIPWGTDISCGPSEASGCFEEIDPATACEWTVRTPNMCPKTEVKNDPHIKDVYGDSKLMWLPFNEWSPVMWDSKVTVNMHPVVEIDSRHQWVDGLVLQDSEKTLFNVTIPHDQDPKAAKSTLDYVNVQIDGLRILELGEYISKDKRVSLKIEELEKAKSIFANDEKDIVMTVSVDNNYYFTVTPKQAMLNENVLEQQQDALTFIHLDTSFDYIDDTIDGPLAYLLYSHEDHRKFSDDAIATANEWLDKPKSTYLEGLLGAAATINPFKVL